MQVEEIVAWGTCIGAFFTALAAFAAWRAAATTAREARARSHPFVGVGIPRFDHANHAIIVPLKNMGLGPAVTIAVVLRTGEREISARIAPGLAPMEAADWMMYVVAVDGGERPPLPSLDELDISGSADDASGRRHPLHAFGAKGAPLSFPGGGAPIFGESRLRRWLQRRSK